MNVNCVLTAWLAGAALAGDDAVSGERPSISDLSIIVSSVRILGISDDRCFLNSRKGRALSVPRRAPGVQDVTLVPPGLGWGHATKNRFAPAPERVALGELEYCWDRPHVYRRMRSAVACGREIVAFQRGPAYRMYANLRPLVATLPSCQFEQLPPEQMSDALEAVPRPDRKFLISVLTEWSVLRGRAIGWDPFGREAHNTWRAKQCVRGRCDEFIEQEITPFR